MSDVFTPEQRSRVMASIAGRDTGPEVALRKALWAEGVRGWRCHRADLPGKPDVAFGRGKLAVFVDGAFWHGHPSKFQKGKSGDFWDAKIARNIERDTTVNRLLADAGWTVVRIWDFEISDDAARCALRVRETLEALRGSS